MNRPVSLFLAAACVAAVAVPAATADARASRAAQSVHVASSHHVVAPSTMRPGLVDVRNTGKASLYIVRKKKWGVKSFVADYNSPSPINSAVRYVTLDNLAGRTDAYLNLSRGTYFVVDGDLGKISVGLVKVVTVKGSTYNAVRPSSSVVTISGKKSALTTSAKLPAKRYLHVTNKTGKTQWVLLYGIGSGTSDAQLAAFVASPSLKKLTSLDRRSYRVLMLASPHQALYYHLKASAGRYLMATFAFTDGSKSTTPSFGKGQAVTVHLH